VLPKVHMKVLSVCLLCAAFVLPVRGGRADAQIARDNPRAAQALEKVIQKGHFGTLHYLDHEIATFPANDPLPYLGGVLFARYQHADGTEVTIFVQWMEKEEDLPARYGSEVKTQIEQQPGFNRVNVGQHVVWRKGDTGYLWTDGNHSIVTIEGPSIPTELVERYLDVIPGQEREAPSEPDGADARDE